MKDEKMEVVRGSGNAFHDFGHPSPDVAQLKAILAAEIVKKLDKEKLTVRAAHALTGIAAADFSRIRNADMADSQWTAWFQSLIVSVRALK